MNNTRGILKQRAAGIPREQDFELLHAPAARPGAGELLCETRYLSLDPYLRGQISGRHISGAVNVGELMGGEAVSRVIESRADGFEQGDIIAAHSGWQSHPVVQAATARKLNPALGPLSTLLGILGMPGLTAYAGMTRLADLQAGDTVVVSAASGPVGSMVGQIAKRHGCRSVGIAGSEEKCRWTVAQAGFEHCINYKTETLRDGLKRACPDGINVYFDNVGGDTLQACMEQLALGARVILCGLMAQYNTDDIPPGPNPGLIIRARATVRGLVVYDHEDLRPEFEQQVSHWLQQGQLSYKEDLAEGLQGAPGLFCRLMRGENFGKAIVRVAE
ncbi:MAG: NADP-dependent oxidoreductase [Gammaproteobacteria bacterium]|nr:NADP-dependent oxidoreductase [Gammaproteobacteria bacterium]